MAYPRVQCSGCWGTKWSDELKSKCPECQGIGSFPHWKVNDEWDRSQVESELKDTRTYLGMAKAELMDYVSGGREADDEATQDATMDRLRWERDYWAFRVQTLQGELELMKGEKGGQSVTASH